MGSVAVNGPKTPVTAGSTGIAAATIPNVCKMPGPPAPFVPVPLPNIGKSGDSPKDYSTSVKIEGNKVAIKGATFNSMGDIASKGTGGGIVSSNTHGPTSFVGPGSMDVRIEGKNVQLLTDPMLNNNGPSGNPPNAATMTGVMQAPDKMAIIYGDDTTCPICQETHPLPEGGEAGAVVALVMKKLNEAYQNQRERIIRLEKINGEIEELDENIDAETPHELSLLMAERNRLNAEKGRLFNFFRTEAVLRFDRVNTGTFSQGYMVGAFICSCLTGKKNLITTSGDSPPGFVKAVDGTGFEFVGNTFTPTADQLRQVGDIQPGREVWSCAAPKLIDAAAGHKASQMSERMFAPRSGGPKIAFKVKQLDGKMTAKTKRFDSGAACPSCEICQVLLPAMLCKTKCN